LVKRAVIVLIVLLFLTLSLAHADAVDFSRPDNALTIELAYGGQALSGIKLGLFLVAAVDEVNGAPEYTVISSLEPTKVLLPPDGVLTAAENKNLSQSLDAYLKANNIARTVQVTNGQGQAVFTDLPAGLYLAAQTDAAQAGYQMAPFLVAVPYQDQRGWNKVVVAFPKTEPLTPPGPPPGPGPLPGPGPSPEPGDGPGSDAFSDSGDSWGSMKPLSIGPGEESSPADSGLPEASILSIPGSPEASAVPGAPGAAASLPALAQTGLLRWPIPLLCGLGTLFILAGLLSSRRKNKKNTVEK